MIFAAEEYIAYARQDVGTILPDFKRWFEKDIRGSDNAECVVCTEDAGRNCSKCTTCRAKTCVDCFPNVVHFEEDEVLFACPVCRKVSLAVDALQPCIDQAVQPVGVWAAMRTAIRRCGGAHTGCVVAMPSRVVVTMDARVSRGGRVVFMSKHHRFARELVTQPGCVIGIGHLPLVMPTSPTAVAVDPDGRGFLVGGDGLAYQLEKGWQYVLGVFVR